MKTVSFAALALFAAIVAGCARLAASALGITFDAAVIALQFRWDGGL